MLSGMGPQPKPFTGGDLNPSGIEMAVTETANEVEPYQISAGDVLGIYVEGVLGKYDSDPPIHYPPAGSGLPPAIGFPIQVRHDGTISLPLIDPIKVTGKTIVEIKAMIFNSYTSGDNPILIGDEAKIFVSEIQTRRSRFASQMRMKMSGISPRGFRPPINVDVASKGPYRIGSGDVLAVFIERVLGKSHIDPPVQIPKDPNLPPVIGYPIPVRQDGTIAVPMIEPVTVRGLTLIEIEQLLLEKYIKGDDPILNSGHISVGLMHRRTDDLETLSQDGDTSNIADLQAAKRRREKALDFFQFTQNQYDEGTDVTIQDVAQAGEEYHIADARVTELLNLNQPETHSEQTDNEIPTRGGEEVSPPTINSGENEINQLQIELMDLKNQFGPSHPSIMKLETRINSRQQFWENQKTQSSSDTPTTDRPTINPQTNDILLGGPSLKTNPPTPVYNGEIYEVWLHVAMTETNPEILVDALNGLSALWEEQNESDFFDAMVRLRVHLRSCGLLNGGYYHPPEYVKQLSRQNSRLLRRLSPQQALRLILKDMASGDGLVKDENYFYNLEEFYYRNPKFKELPAAEKIAFVEDAVTAMSSLPRITERKIRFIGKLETYSDWEYSQSPTARKMFQEFLEQSEDNSTVSEQDIYLARCFPDSTALSKRLVRILNEWNGTNPKGWYEQLPVLGRCARAMNDENKKMIYQKLIALWAEQIDLRKVAAKDREHPLFGSLTKPGTASLLEDGEFLRCLQLAPEYVEPYREELSDILSTFTRSKNNDDFISKFEKLLAQNPEEETEK